MVRVAEKVAECGVLEKKWQYCAPDQTPGSNCHEEKPEPPGRCIAASQESQQEDEACDYTIQPRRDSDLRANSEALLVQWQASTRAVPDPA